jgi:competence protein ComEA
MNWKPIIKDYFTFTRRERIGFLALICLILIISLLPKAISNKNNTKSILADTAWIAAAKKLENKEAENKDKRSFTSHSGNNDYAYQYDRSVNSSSGSLFYFDPNTLNENGWKKLGLKNKIIHTIQNYLTKGGHFNKPEDLQKIYGLHKNEYERLAPYVKIENKLAENKPVEYVKKETGPRNFSYSPIDINTADTTAFISLPGIGSKLAARIVNFRDKLGGFYSINQVGETYGVPDSTFQKIKQYLALNTIAVKKININTATVDELKTHPYIRYSIANPIVAYRNEHGPFSNVEQIKKVAVITEEIYTRISPYLTSQ